MAGHRALVVIFSLTAACLPGQPRGAALAGEVDVELPATCSSGDLDAEGSCVAAAQEDGMALLQHGPLERQQVKAHVSPQEGLSLEASKQQASETSEQATSEEASPGSDAEVSAARPGSSRSLLSTRGSEQPMMKDVLGAFNALGDASSNIIQVNLGRLFPSGYNKGYMPYSEHFQGIQRQQGQNYLFVTGSGETENTGHVFVSQVASRPSSGAMGSNAVSKWGRPANPPRSDILKKVLKVDSQYWHAGGASSFGDYLAVGSEAGCSTTERLFGQCSLESRIHFYDTSNPQSPQKLPYVVNRKTASAGAVALTQLEDGRFMLMVGRVDSEILDFYLSSGKSLKTNPHFKLVKTWYKDSLLAAPGQWADFGQYQNLHFVRQQDGKLFLIGTYRTMNGLGDDTADLFSVDARKPQRLSIKKESSMHLSCQSGTCNFQAGAGVYVDSETTLILYSTDWEPKDNSIYVNEWVGESSGESSGKGNGKGSGGWGYGR